MNFTKLPNKGHSLNKGQKPVYQSVRYSESTLYILVQMSFTIAMIAIYTYQYNKKSIQVRLYIDKFFSPAIVDQTMYSY